MGVNFVPTSRRFVKLERARELVSAVAGRIEIVGVVADAANELVQRIRGELGIEWLQLHGEESPARLTELGPSAFRAIGVASADDVAAARRFGGERLLVDAKLEPENAAPDAPRGGGGRRFDWALVRELVRERNVILAGGLRAENVAQAIRTLAPFGVDVASGVESAPGKKAPELV